MLIARNPRPLTPYQWCVHVGAEPGDSVDMLHVPLNRPTRFIVADIDHETKTVTFKRGVAWHAREWREMDRDAMYELVKKGA